MLNIPCFHRPLHNCTLLKSSFVGLLIGCPKHLSFVFQGRFDDVQKAPKLPSAAPRETKELVCSFTY